MKKINFLFFAVSAFLVLATPACRAAAAPPTERGTLDQDFDNRVSSAPDRLEYDKIADNLRATLQLDDKQERKLRAILRDHNRRFDTLFSSYTDANLRLQREREELMRLRSEIKSRLDSISDVVYSQLELDQKEDYKKMLQEAKGIKQPIVAVSTATAKAVSAKAAAPATKSTAKKRIVKKKKAAKKAVAAAPAESSDSGTVIAAPSSSDSIPMIQGSTADSGASSSTDNSDDEDSPKNDAADNAGDTGNTDAAGDSGGDSGGDSAD